MSLAVVTANAACLWTDGRYYAQAANELSSDWTLMKSSLSTVPTIEVTIFKKTKYSNCNKKV